MDQPSHDARATFLECISRARNPARKKLHGVVDDVVAAGKKCEVAFATASTHSLVESEFHSAAVSSAQLEATYTVRMVPENAPGRSIYDELKLAAPDGLCPTCGQREAGQLDHLLPKAIYPLVSVLPLNLVPACGECNHTKLASVATCAEDAPIHPYYDDIDTDIWLVAEVIEGSPPGAIFRVSDSLPWPPVQIERVRRHFKNFGLAKLYAAQAGVELRGIDVATRRAFARGGADEVRLQLSDQVAGRQLRFLNNWQAATYRALALSNWYCNDRFL